jgi:hypothetical protein
LRAAAFFSLSKLAGVLAMNLVRSNYKMVFKFKFKPCDSGLSGHCSSTRTEPPRPRRCRTLHELRKGEAAARSTGHRISGGEPPQLLPLVPLRGSSVLELQ